MVFDKLISNAKYWKSLPVVSYLKFLLAIFFIFSILGFITDLFYAGQFSIWMLGLTLVSIGLFAVAWVIVFTRLGWWLVLLPFLVSGLYVLNRLSFNYGISSQPESQIPGRVFVDGMGILLFLMIGFIFFIDFILGEGRNQIRLKTKVDLAKSMHNTLVPVISKRTSRLRMYGKSVAAESMGGDLIDVIESPQADLCYIADVSGHGVQAGLLMGMVKTAFHSNSERNVSPGNLLSVTNKTIHPLSHASMFVTCTCMQFLDDRLVKFSVAGHLPILHVSRVSGQIVQLLTKQLPLAVKPDVQFEEQTVQFQSGDLFVLMSDGLTEVRNRQNEEFGLDRIQALIQSNMHALEQDLYDLIQNTVDEFGKQRDDQSMLLIRCE